MLFFLGERRPSSDILKVQANNIKHLNKTTLSALHNVSDLAQKMRDTLRKNDLSGFESILREGWEQKKKFARGVTNDHIERICRVIENNGANSMKITGSGGGGHLFVYADQKKHNKIIKAMKKIKIPKVEFQYKKSNTITIDVRSLSSLN